MPWDIVNFEDFIFGKSSQVVTTIDITAFLAVETNDYIMSLLVKDRFWEESGANLGAFWGFEFYQKEELIYAEKEL